MQKEKKQRNGPQEKSKSFPSKENPQSSLIPIQRRRSSTCTRKPRNQKLASDRDEQLIHYQTIPERRFSTDRAREIIKSVVDERLETVEYSCACALICRELSDRIKTAVKKLLLLYDRYKLVCFVVIGQLKDSGVTCSSRAIWSPTADTFTEYVYKNRSLFAVCVLFAVYKE